MKVTEIEVHEITPPYVDWLAYPLNHYYGPSKRTIYIAHTDTGLEGLGEWHDVLPQDVVEKYIGTSPFDWVGDDTSLGLGMAMYDLMGQAVGVPVYKLIGQKRRSWVPRGSWTVSTHPKRMAEAVERYAAQGFTWMKFHLSPFENVIDQSDAMQAVAPPGFKVHYDFTMHGTDDHMPELIEKLAAYSVAGCFEDPLESSDIAAHIDLRRRSKLPIVLHHAPLAFTHEVLMDAADAYMIGHGNVGMAIEKAGLFAAANRPFMLQNVGGHITTAMTTHMMSTFPTGTFHFICAAETLADDVTQERFDVVNGFVRVPEKPGLGVTLDRDALERTKSLQLPEQPKWIIKSRYGSGAMMYNIADTDNPIFMVRPDRARQITLRYDAPISTEYWDDDGSSEYRKMFERIEREGVVLEKP